MQESELLLDQAIDSSALIQEIHALLTKTPTSDFDQWINSVSLCTTNIIEILKNTPEKYASNEWNLFLSGLRVLNALSACVNIAHGGKGNITEEHYKYEVLYREFQSQLRKTILDLPTALNSNRQNLVNKDQCDLEELCNFLNLIPLSTLYWRVKKENIKQQDDISNTLRPILRVIIFLDNEPIASPKLLKPNLLYPLKFCAKGLIWPENATKIRLDLITTCPSTFFTASKFILNKPMITEEQEYNGEMIGNIIFNGSQSSFVDDIIFSISCAFETDNGELMEVPVIGHNKLCVKVTDESQHPLMSGNKLLDRHVEMLITKLLKEYPKISSEIPDLLSMLQALTRLLSNYSQGAIFKKSNILESDFQIKVLSDLRLILGSDVEEHTGQAGGFTDIRYHGVIVELKVEKENGERKYICEKYTSQSSQYAGVEARQVSIVLVLDLTSKENPPSDICNDIILTDVKTHGGTDESKQYPSKAFVFVINGNIKNPSYYSK